MKTNSTKVTDIVAQNFIEFSEFKFLIKFFSFENFEISDEKYFHLRVLKIIENVNYITHFQSQGHWSARSHFLNLSFAGKVHLMGYFPQQKVTIFYSANPAFHIKHIQEI